MRTHTVRQGECLSSIAALYGYAWETVYRAPENADLRQLRPNPNLLFPGDEVAIPERVPVGRSVNTGAQHTFRIQRQRKRLYLEFRHLGEPESGLEYEVFDASADPPRGETDSNGAIDVLIGTHVEHVRIHCGGEDYDVLIGHLDPIVSIDEQSRRDSLLARLRNLGLSVSTTSATDLEQAIAHFQAISGLPVTGEADEKTCRRLEGLHGS